eukprot:3731572-Rhodomonas_salina.1
MRGKRTRRGRGQARPRQRRDTHTVVTDTHTVVTDTHTVVPDTHTVVPDTHTVVPGTHTVVPVLADTATHTGTALPCGASALQTCNRPDTHTHNTPVTLR